MSIKLLEPPTETKRERTDKSKIPREIWALQITDNDLRGGGQGLFVLAQDSAGEPFLCFKSEADAKESARYHLDYYDIGCEPVRLK